MNEERGERDCEYGPQNQKCIPESWSSDSRIMKEDARIVICICTYRRPRELERLLESLGKLSFTTITEPQISVLVVENDANALAREVCERYMLSLRWQLQYAIEEVPGISQARNRCLSLLAKDTNFLVFVDDDEVVAEHWLEDLVLAQKEYGADVVAGPVLPRYEVPPPHWMQKAGIHERARRETGTAIFESATNNVLVARSLVIECGLKFDHEFGLIGGSDKLFFQTADRMGAKMIWCDEALVYEYVSPERATISAILERSLRIGITDSKVLLRLEGPFKSRLMFFWRGLSRFLGGTILAPIMILGGRPGLLWALRRTVYGLGSLMGGFGFSYSYYRRNL